MTIISEQCLIISIIDTTVVLFVRVLVDFKKAKKANHPTVIISKKKFDCFLCLTDTIRLKSKMWNFDLQGNPSDNQN